MFWKIRIYFESIFDQLMLSLGKVLFGLPQAILHKIGFRLPSREHILLLILNFRLSGSAAEVGVFQGDFSEKILCNTNVAKLYSIDPWKEFNLHEYYDLANEKQATQDYRYEITRQRLAKYAERSKIIRDISRNAAEMFEDLSLDFIYIDANHSYEFCLQDLKIWWPKLKSKAIIAGDDYTNFDNGLTKYGVKSAVDEFFKGREKVYLTYKSGKIHWPNWYVIKS